MRLDFFSLFRVLLIEPLMEYLASWGNGWCEAWTGSRFHNPPVAVDLVPVRTMTSHSVTIK
jgi:hypothetical protein